MRTALASTFAVLVLVVTGCGGGEKPGAADVYKRIDATTDCTALQGEFDRAATTHDRAQAGSKMSEIALSYMTAANDRMEDIGCYD